MPADALAPAEATTGSVALVVGTRPESIKMAPVADQLGDDAVVVHTGQHDSPGMIQPHPHRQVVELPALRHTSRGAQLGRTIAALDALFTELRPDVVAVQGDTTSAVAAALAANAAHIPLLHVEAGLRSFDRRMPEEHNRVLIDHIADLCCAPTTLAVAHLRREGLPEHRVVLTGNPVVEAATRALPPPSGQLAVLREIGVHDDGYVLATVHRPENVDDDVALDAILLALARSPMPVVLPVHPRLHTRLAPRLPTLEDAHIRLTGPLEYPQLLAVAQHARLLVTDSGGLQEEATVLKKPIIVVRRSNERPEIEGLFGCRVTPAALLPAVAASINERRPSTDLRSIPSPYGDGTAATRIAAEARCLRASTRCAA
jgi:UDP-N-acetylglucosamine 2-epimerase (non-hydrolysing)